MSINKVQRVETRKSININKNSKVKANQKNHQKKYLIQKMYTFSIYRKRKRKPH